jgi:hypothetical protein
MMCLSVQAAFAQTLPAKVTGFLNKYYAGWKKAPGTCENRKWVLTGDFDGDGMKDYVVRVKTGKTAKSMRLNLVAFFNAGDGNYRAQQILDDPYKGDLLRSSFAVIKKGTKIQLGEGEGPTITLENDAASQYICQTDAIKTLIYKDGKWKNIYDQ